MPLLYSHEAPESDSRGGQGWCTYPPQRPAGRFSHYAKKISFFYWYALQTCATVISHDFIAIPRTELGWHSRRGCQSPLRKDSKVVRRIVEKPNCCGIGKFRVRSPHALN